MCSANLTISKSHVCSITLSLVTLYFFEITKFAKLSQELAPRIVYTSDCPRLFFLFQRRRIFLWLRRVFMIYLALVYLHKRCTAMLYITRDWMLFSSLHQCAGHSYRPQWPCHWLHFFLSSIKSPLWFKVFALLSALSGLLCCRLDKRVTVALGPTKKMNGMSLITPPTFILLTFRLWCNQTKTIRTQWFKRQRNCRHSHIQLNDKTVFGIIYLLVV